jgi:Protein of unknown function (DUF3892)
MADKWADFVITAVRFNSADTHIAYVQAREDEGNTISEPPTTKSRTEVVTQIEAGYSFCTATKSSDGKWVKGAMVKVVTIEATKYIKTKADGIKKDNLDNLPTF